MAEEQPNQQRPQEHRSPATENLKCADCTTYCVLRKNLLAKNQEAKCLIPQAREHAITYNHPVIDKDVLLSLASKTLYSTHNKLAEGTALAMKDRKDYFDMIIKFKDTFYPDVTKNANLNINVNTARDIIDTILGDQP